MGQHDTLKMTPEVFKTLHTLRSYLAHYILHYSRPRTPNTHGHTAARPACSAGRGYSRVHDARVCASISRKLATAMAMLVRSSRSCFQRMVSQPLPPAFSSAFFFLA